MKNADRIARPGPVLLAVLLVIAATSSACDASDDATGTTDLEVERTTEGDVTTVRNLAGSTWGAPAVLVEDLAIGVFEGAEEYMFGQVRGLWVTEEEVYVVDSQAPTVRVYDHEGTWLRDIGQQGEGPGEFDRPSDIAILEDGTIVVLDSFRRRLVFFEANGTPQRTWRLETGFPYGLQVLHDGTLLVNHSVPREEGVGAGFMSRSAFSRWLPEAGLGEPHFPPMFGFEDEPVTIETGGRLRMAMSGSVLFRPSHVWTVRRDMAVVAGVGDQYRFEIHRRDGSVISVERYWEPVPVHDDEAAYRIARLEGSARQVAPGWTYDGKPPAEHKPAFRNLVADREDRIWVHRPGEARRVEDCVEDAREQPQEAMRRPCWPESEAVDVFAPDGTYLGEVERPEGLSYSATFINGEHYWAAVEDEDGLVTVRRFRIRLPADAQETS